MVRVVRPGGLIAAYVWDMPGGGFPFEPILDEMRAMGLSPPAPPMIDASRMDVLQRLWADAGLDGVETRDILVRRSFASFEELWAIGLASAAVGSTVAALPASDIADLRARVCARLMAPNEMGLDCSARAHAIRGRRPP
jgi:hypothetical protein